ncbi:MAG: hypothetical protein ACLSUW_02085 [Akkermansia sp.]
MINKVIIIDQGTIKAADTLQPDGQSPGRRQDYAEFRETWP